MPDKEELEILLEEQQEYNQTQPYHRGDKPETKEEQA